MLSEFLILKVDGKNICFGTMRGDIRLAILSLPDDDVDSMQVEKLYGVDSHAAATDVTAEFAAHWSSILTAADPVPAFVGHHCPERKIEFAA